jgi:hypothetical protein
VLLSSEGKLAVLALSQGEAGVHFPPQISVAVAILIARQVSVEYKAAGTSRIAR